MDAQRLRIKSTLRRGTTVEIYLPRSRAPGETAERQSWERWPSLAARGTALVVDDQDDVREAAVAQLEALGFDEQRCGAVGRRSLRPLNVAPFIGPPPVATQKNEAGPRL